METRRSLPTIAALAFVVAPIAVVVLSRGDAEWTAPAAPPEGPVLVVGGDVNLGRWQNLVTAERGPEDAFRRVPDLEEADLTFVNLECVVSTSGEYRADKNEEGPYYFRGRPEMLSVLRRSGVDVVGTANNHTGDYGPTGVVEQGTHLDAWGIAHAGSGEDREAACAPVVRHAGDLAVAFFSIDATKQPFAAGESRPGTCWLDPKGDDAPDAWRRHFEGRIAKAREQADLVMVAVHWGSNQKTEPTPRLLELGHVLVDAGADAVLGSSAHVLQGVEVYRGRPILRDAGNLLFDATDRDRTATAVFSLVLGPSGVRAVSATPVWSEYGTSRVATADGADSILGMLDERSRALGTRTAIADERLWFEVPEPPERPAPPRRAPPDPPLPPEPAISVEPPPGCMAAEVPADARIAPVRMGPLTLIGARTGPERLVGRGMVDVETWWTVDAPIEGDLWLDPRAHHLDGAIPVWSRAHDGCDWVWPISRWEPGVIWYDQYAMRPPERFKGGNYRLEIEVAEPHGAVLATHEIGALRVLMP